MSNVMNVTSTVVNNGNAYSMNSVPMSTMAEKKRPRACDTCHSIKIKCELGSTGGDPPCARCQRLGKECIVSTPKRQKDRVAELEAQVEALTKLLQSQNIQPELSPVESSDPTPQALSQTTSRSRSGTATAPYTSQKKRRLDENFTPSPSDNEAPVDGSTFVELDTVLSRHVQEELLVRYLRDLVPYFPIVPIAGDQSYEALRKERPLLLQAAVYCASFGALPLEQQEDVGKVVMDLFAAKAMAEGEKSAELVQAMQAAVLYYRTTKHHTHIAAWQFIQLAGGLAEDIGIGGPSRPPALNVPTGGPYIDSSEAWRTWLACHMLSATLALFMRQGNASTWDDRDEHNVQMLEYSYFRLEGDELLAQHVRAEHLCDVIATQQCLYQTAPTVDVAEPVVQAGMQRLADKITDWRSQIPSAINGPVMAFWDATMVLYLHEPVLHTATNKSSFAAPYIAPRISVTDFANPLVSQEHLTSIYRIRDSAHALLDVFDSFDTAHLTALPAMYFPGRVAYAIFLLAKLYVAVTAPGNTFGAFVDPESLLLELYLDKMIQAFNRTAAIDEWCGQARILSASFKMREWFKNYKANYSHPTSKSRQGSGDLPVSSYAAAPTTTSAALPAHWSNMNFIDSTHDLGLEDFFADPHMTDWFPQPLDNAVPVSSSAADAGYIRGYDTATAFPSYEQT